MNKIILLILLTNTYIFSNINAIVSILPQQTFLKAIGGDKVNVALMVQPGNSPHTYEPKPSQMIDITKADIYFTIDVEFEHVWLVKFKNLNAKMQVIDVTQGIKKMPMTSTHEEHEGHGHHNESLDPHIWTSPANVKVLVNTIYNALVKLDPNHTSYYKKNLDTFIVKLEKTDTQIKEILSHLKDGRRFMVFHPSWAYFAKAYDLEQVAVEVEGKSPKPRELIGLIKKAQKEKVKAIFTQPEFSDSSAKIIAKALQIPVIKVSPLAGNWADNLVAIAKHIAGKK